MNTTNKRNVITVETTIQSSLQKVWDCFTDTKHIVNWNFASNDWHTPRAENDLRVEGRLVWRMESKDGSMGFDFSGTYITIDPLKSITYTIDDGRQVQIQFYSNGTEVKVTETFEAEDMNSLDLQKTGWQAILTNFKKYVESA